MRSARNSLTSRERDIRNKPPEEKNIRNSSTTIERPISVIKTKNNVVMEIASLFMYTQHQCSGPSKFQNFVRILNPKN